MNEQYYEDKLEKTIVSFGESISRILKKYIDSKVQLREKNMNAKIKISKRDKEFLKKIHGDIIEEEFYSDEESNNELKYYKWGFECPNIDNLKTKEEKDIMYSKILNQFQEQLKEWIYKKS